MSESPSANSPVVPQIPPLAGLCSFEAASAHGMSVDECVAWLKRLHYLFRQLHEIFTARITSEPLYELKTAFSHHGWLCAEQATALRTRVGEMREPPLGLEAVPHPGLKLAVDEVRSAPDATALCVGLYDLLLPSLRESLEEYRQATNPLADAPSVRLSRFALLDVDDMLRFGRVAIEGLATTHESQAMDGWRELLRQSLKCAGGISGRGEETTVLPSPCYSARPWHYDPVPRRDARFHDSYNGGVNPEAFLYDERFSPRDKTLMLFYKRLREIDVPEMMASILVESPEKPWGFHHDMSRQLWDEARHAMMGEVGFHQLGIDWTRIPINYTWSLNLNTQLTAQERHAVLFFIEQGLMPRTGKRYEWEVGKESGVALASLFQDFDWADEVLHAQLGREWYVKGFGDLNSALAYGDRCWSKVMSRWGEYREQGLTQHRNWWPELYANACAILGVPPDTQAAAFCETYETVRADLKEISASG